MTVSTPLGEDEAWAPEPAPDDDLRVLDLLAGFLADGLRSRRMDFWDDRVTEHAQDFTPVESIGNPKTYANAAGTALDNDRSLDALVYATLAAAAAEQHRNWLLEVDIAERQARYREVQPQPARVILAFVIAIALFLVIGLLIGLAL